MQTAKCPVCRSDVVVGDDAFEGDIVECANCNSISETTSLHPVTLNVIEDNSGVKKEEEE